MTYLFVLLLCRCYSLGFMMPRFGSLEDSEGLCPLLLPPVFHHARRTLYPGLALRAKTAPNLIQSAVWIISPWTVVLAGPWRPCASWGKGWVSHRWSPGCWIFGLHPRHLWTHWSVCMLDLFLLQAVGILMSFEDIAEKWLLGSDSPKLWLMSPRS